MTASTFLGPGYQPWLARLFNPDGAWCSATNDEHQFLQIQFAQIRLIRELRIQGSVAMKAWVKAYKLEYSEYGETWATYDNLGQVTNVTTMILCGVMGCHVITITPCDVINESVSHDHFQTRL